MYENKKYLWCPKCNNFPDNIIETNLVEVSREWINDCYEMQDQEVIEEKGSGCGVCGTRLENKE